MGKRKAQQNAQDDERDRDLSSGRGYRGPRHVVRFRDPYDEGVEAARRLSQKFREAVEKIEK